MLPLKRKKKRLCEIAKEILGENEEPQPNQVTVSLDESHWDLIPRPGRVWTPPEVEQLSFDIPENKKDSFTTYGALELATGRFVYKISPWGTSWTFREFLYQIEARYPGKEIHIILDNSKTHIAELIQGFLEDHPHIHLHFLLPRGSEVNPIERFWRYCKDKIKKGVSFTVISELYHAVRRFFWRYSNGFYRYHSNVTIEKLALAS